MTSRVVSLEEACSLITDGTHYSPPDVRTGVPFLTVKDLTDEALRFETAAHISQEEYERAAAASSAPRPGDVLFSKDGTIGKVHVVKEREPFAVLSSIAILRPNPDVLDSGYLGFVLRSPRVLRSASGSKTGSALTRIILKDLKQVRIPLPPLAEQRRIAAVLDKADAIRRQRRESLPLLDEFLRSAFLETFGDPVKNEKGWETLPLGQVAEVERGKFTPRPRNDPQFYNGRYPFIQTGDIAQSDGVVRGWHQTLNERGAGVSRRFPAGTIALAIAANIADTAIVEFDFYCPDSVVGIAPNKKVARAEYLEACLRFFKPVLAARAPMTAQRNINLQVLRPLRVPVPPLDLQERFCRSRALAQSLADRMRSHAEGLDTLFDSLAQRAFRGELRSLTNNEREETTESSGPTAN